LELERAGERGQKKRQEKKLKNPYFLMMVKVGP